MINSNEAPAGDDNSSQHSPEPGPNDPIRVSRFVWERLLMMSDLPEGDRFKLLALGIFMSADGGRARPGNLGLAHFGPHEKTWAKLLRNAVKSGWLILVERGGARRGTGGTTFRKASVYAASAPWKVWSCRTEILNSSPYKAASLEGSAETSSVEQPKQSPTRSPVLKGAPRTPFNGSLPKLKGAAKGSLQASEANSPWVLKGAPETPLNGFEGSLKAFEGSAQRLPHHVIPPSRTYLPGAGSQATSSTPPQAHGKDGGGEDSEWQQQALLILDSLDYRNRPPSRTQRTDLAQRLGEALATGWTVEALQGYLDLGSTTVHSAVGVYFHRLKPSELPEPPTEQPGPAAIPSWCGQCADGNPAADQDPSLRWVDTDDGTHPCPRCSLQATQNDAA
ncbi:hypothetical protein [Streptomyces sp. NPDC006784]|uniref:hypothetical protein n=1 Tax=Streptomyces sp. NPDC006784 TaxID=3364764 RepID=UPI0036D0DE0F